MKTTIELIGISSGTISDNALGALRRCNVAVTSSRYRKIVERQGIRKIIPVTPVKKMLDEMEMALSAGNVAVLASGDPLFFGIGRTLITRFGANAINIYPALSSMQLACASFKIPWDDMKFVSLHGREPHDTVSIILRNSKTVILTDQRNRPDTIADMILQRLESVDSLDVAKAITVHVGENLGQQDQQLFTGTLEETAAKKFASLNLMVVINGSWQTTNELPVLGLTEAEITHSRALITKNEVRAAALHALRIGHSGCLWDIGAGSGSISIEAASMCPSLTIYAIEHKPEQQENIIKNIRKFGYWNIHLIKGSAPEALHSLPSPQRIFIGGSGGRLEAIIRLCSRRLSKGGRIVVNALLEKTAIQAPFILRDTGMSVSWSRIAVERSEGDGPLNRLNTITVITGTK